MGDVEWPKDPGAYEQAIAVLLSCMHPQLLRVDGSGGDGGRDAQLTGPDGLHVFEMKSFTGRMTKGRREKVEKSLGRAALLNPVSWDVIVPIDLNPTEEKWFSSLQQRFSFPLSWRGATWIKARLAEHPAVRRFYFADHHAELGHLLQEIARSHISPVDTTADAAARLRQLCDRLAELDPHYDFRITAGPGPHTGIEVLPAYPGADRDQPLHIALSITDPDTPEGKSAASEFERCRRYGDPIELPAHYVRLSGLLTPPAAGLRPSPPRGDCRAPGPAGPADRYRPSRQAPRRTRAPYDIHPLRLPWRNAYGSRLHRSHQLSASPRSRDGNSSIKIDMNVPDALRPGQWLDVVRFASHAEPATYLQMTLAGHAVNDPAPFLITAP